MIGAVYQKTYVGQYLGQHQASMSYTWTKMMMMTASLTFPVFVAQGLQSGVDAECRLHVCKQSKVFHKWAKVVLGRRQVQCQEKKVVISGRRQVQGQEHN